MHKFSFVGLLILMGCSTFAKNASLADSGTQDEKTILTSTVITATGKILNEKHSGQCLMPIEDKDVHWMCLGALRPVSEATIMPSTCGFEVEIVCPGETLKIYGKRVSYFLQMPLGQKTSVKQTEPTISFTEMVTVN
jgi:hypothetical protein